MSDQKLVNFLGKSLGRGVATGGTKTTLIDTLKVFEADILNGTVLRINVDGIDYYRTVTDTADSTITFATLPGTPAVAVWTVDTGVTITVTSVADGGNQYSISAALAIGNNKPLAVALVNDVITVTLATGAAGLSNDVANTVTLVTAAIDALAGFTAVAAGSGATVVAATTTAVAFENGVDEVKPVVGTRYEIAKRSASTTTLYGSIVSDITFHNEAVVAADGTVYTLDGDKTLTVEIYGTSTSRTIAFIGRGASGADRAISGINLNGFASAINTTGTGELWQFDITGLTSVFMDLQAVAGGNVSVKGKAVA